MLEQSLKFNILWVYFSTKSENTHRFVQHMHHKYGYPCVRIPYTETEWKIPDDYITNGEINPYILVTPTYGGGHLKGSVPIQVIRFLNQEKYRKNLKGVIACGDTNFGDGFCSAGTIIAQKCHVPHLYNIELWGQEKDEEKINKNIQKAIDFYQI